MQRQIWQQIQQATFVRTVEHHREILSTNTRALSWAEDSTLELPALVLADVQTAGRGRGTNRWWSAPGRFDLLAHPPASSLDSTSHPGRGSH